MKFKEIIKKHGKVICFAALLICLSAIIALARYVDANNKMKRTVVSMAETEDARFTSNLLVRTEDPSPRTFPVSDSTKITIGEYEYYEVQVIVRNYTTTDTMHYYDRDLQYTLTAKLVGLSGSNITDENKAELIRYGQNGTGEFTLSGEKYTMSPDTVTLNAAADGTHDKTYYFYYRTDLLDAADNVFVKISAVPTDNDIKAEVGSLRGIIGISRQSSVIVKTWSGNFSDEGAALTGESHAVEADEYDGFNYIIQGNGQAKVSIKWDNTKLELNPFSINDLKSVSDVIDNTVWSKTNSGTNNEYTTIVFMVDSEKCARYDVQFYMKGTELDDWDEVM